MPRPDSGFHYKDGELCCESIPLRQIADQYSTPAYVYSQSSIEANCRHILQAFSDLPCEFFYAVKANSNLAILELIRDQGLGFDIVSGGELRRLLMLEVPGSKIIFSGVGKTLPELELARSAGIRSINVESLAELQLLSELSTPEDPIAVGLRVNPEIAVDTHPYVSTGQHQHKFGIPIQVLEQALDILEVSSLRLATLGCHLGSQILSPEPYLIALDYLQKLASRLLDRGLEVPSLNLGGGFGIAYKESERGFDLEGLGNRLRQLDPIPRLFFEPGRAIIGNAGVLISKVLYQKSTSNKLFLVCDAAMNDLIRPALYGAGHRVCPFHEVTTTCRADLVGPICETGDFLVRDGILPEVAAGDCLAILDTGAYGFALSSNYNSRARAAEVLVADNQARLIRRRETFQDLIRCEKEGNPDKSRAI